MAVKRSQTRNRRWGQTEGGLGVMDADGEVSWIYV